LGWGVLVGFSGSTVALQLGEFDSFFVHRRGERFFAPTDFHPCRFSSPRISYFVRMNFEYITTTDSLQDCLGFLGSATELAVDLEFDKNRYRYGFNLCLMQIRAGDRCFLIDPLVSQLDVSPVFPILENPGVPVITFAFGEDIRLLHSLGCFPKNVHDLSLAMRLINYPPMSLEKLAEQLLGIEPDKSSQQSNWFRRPLTKEQKLYAVRDVEFLFEMRDAVYDIAREKNVMPWIEEENRTYDEMNYADASENDPIREKDKKGLSEYEWHIFKEMARYREQLAEKINRPAYQAIEKSVMVDVTKGKKVSKGGMHPKVSNGEALHQLRNIRSRAEAEADDLGLSKTDRADKSPSPEEMAKIRAFKKRQDRVKNRLFKPIKREFGKDYGEETAAFIFPNRTIGDFVAGGADALPDYKRDILLDYAEKLKLETNPDVIFSE